MSQQTRILIVDQDAIASAALRQTLEGRGYVANCTRTMGDALTELERERASGDADRIGVVIVDQDAVGPGGGVGLVRRLHDDWPAVVPIMTSAFRKLEQAVQAMRLGAADYLLKPIVEKELLDALERAVQRHLLLTDRNTTEDRPAQEAVPRASEPIASPTEAGGWTPMSLAKAMQEPEKRILLAALEANGWNRQETARQLDINRTTLYKKIRQYRLDEPAA